MLAHACIELESPYAKRRTSQTLFLGARSRELIFARGTISHKLDTIPDPAEQVPLVARSVTPPSPSVGERGDDTALAACTSILYRVCYDPPHEHTSEGGRDDRGVPYHAESALSSAQVLNWSFGPI